jgi:hypothetical protein
VNAGNNSCVRFGISDPVIVVAEPDDVVLVEELAILDLDENQRCIAGA